jgi:hypothetical protein
MVDDWWVRIRVWIMESPVFKFRAVVGQVRVTGNVVQYDGV